MLAGRNAAVSAEAVLRQWCPERIVDIGRGELVLALVDSLNGLVDSDPDAMHRLVTHHTPCNAAISDHPCATVELMSDDPEQWGLGLLGVLQAFVGPLGYVLMAQFDTDTQTLVKFSVAPK